MPHESIHHWFAETAAAAPCSQALCFEGSAWTYAQLEQRAEEICGLVRAHRVTAGSRVALLFPPSFNLIACMIAVLRAGAAYVPMNPAYPDSRLEYLIEDSCPLLILTCSDLVERFKNTSVPVAAIYESELVDWEANACPPAVIHPDAAAYVIYTSGSTGDPKGVVVTHRNVMRLFDSTASIYRFGPQDVWTLFHSCAFDFSVWEIWGALLYGGRLQIVPPATTRSPERFYQLLVERQVTVLNQTPSAFYQLMAYEGELQKREELALRYVIFGGEALDFRRVAPWFARHGDSKPRLVNMYGITETTVHVTHRAVCTEDAEHPRGSLIGRAICDLTCYVLDRNMEPAAVGAIGELYIGGAGVARGYLNRPDLTASCFVPDPFGEEDGSRLYRSGDLARLRRDGSLYFLERADSQVKIRGHRIELGEIEAVLSRHPAVLQAVVTLFKDAGGEKSLAAYVVAHQSATTEGLRSWLTSMLPDYSIPSVIIPIESLPLTLNGKLNRKALPNPLEAAPSNPAPVAMLVIEQTVAQVWEQLLSRTNFGPQDNFFSMGGHSLMATRLLARLRQTFSVDLPLDAFFYEPTIAALARQIDAALFGGSVQQLPPLVRSTHPDGARLSYLQNRIWYLHQLDPLSSAYHVPLILNLEGEISVPALKRAFTELVRRHEILRTRIVLRGDDPIQQVIPDRAVQIDLADLSSLEKESAEALARRIIDEQISTPFNFEEGPLLRAGLIRLREDRYVAAIVLHHILLDGWSLGILVYELGTLYQACVEGKASPLAELPVQYADYAEWQRGWFAGEVLDRHLEFWKAELDGVSQSLLLPLDKPRLTAFGPGGAVRFSIPEGMNLRIRELGRSEGVTPFMIYLAALQALLWGYSSILDIAIASPAVHRPVPELEPLIGFFLNTIVLRTRISPRWSWRELLAEVRNTTLRAFAHQDVPIDQIAAAVQPDRDLHANPLFQVVLSVQNPLQPAEAVAGLRTAPFEMGDSVAKLDLTLHIWHRDDGAEGSWEFRSDLFEASTIARLSEHFLLTLAAMIANPDAKLERMRWMTANEQHALLVECNQTAQEHTLPAMLHQAIELQAALTPGRVAVSRMETTLSYRELNDAANRFARVLRAWVNAGERVAVCLERKPAMIVVLLAILKTGAAYVPLDPNHPRQRNAVMLEDAGVRLLVTNEALLERAPAGIEVRTLEDLERAAFEKDPGNLDSIVHSQAPAYVIYTSGSTGKPKGVVISHGAVMNVLQSFEATLGFGADDVVLATTTLCFDIAVLELFLPLIKGGRVELVSDSENVDPGLLIHRIRATRPTIMQATPTFWRMLLGHGWKGDPRMRVLCAGEVLNDALAESLSSRVLELWNGYGPTETTLYSLTSRVKRGASVRIGRPIGNTRVFVLNVTGEPVPHGVIGELFIGGHGVASGYWDQPALTAERFIPDSLYGQPGARLYATGDLVRFLPDGDIEFVGRADYQVKVRGHRIELGELEKTLALHPEVRQAAATVFAQTDGQNALAAYVSPASLDSGEIRHWVRERMPDYFVPSLVYPMEELPLTSNGKVNRKALPPPVLTSVKSMQPALPRTRMEEAIASVWQQLLPGAQIGVHENFFDAGGHSILLAQLHNRLRQKLEREFSILDLLQHPTIASFATSLSGPDATELNLTALTASRAGQRRTAAARPRRTTLA